MRFFAISGIIKVIKTLIIPDIAKTETNNCFIIHWFTGKRNNDKQFQHLCPSCLPASERCFPQGIRGTVSSQFLTAFFCFPSLFVSAIFQFLSQLKKRIDAHEFTSLSDASHIALGNHALRVQPTDYSLIC